MKKKYNLLIVGSGEATRLKPFTTYIPKFLISLWKKPALIYMLNYWLNLLDLDNIIITVNPKFKEITKNYIKLFLTNDVFKKIKIIPIEWYYWSADATIKAINKIWINENLIISWSDILPKETIKKEIFDKRENIIFLNKEKWCRYNFDNWNIELVKNNQGNIIWLYYFKKFNFTLKDYVKGEDLIDVIKKSKIKVKGYELSFYDFWDYEKWKSTQLELDDNAREFNSLILIWNFYYKQALNDKWKDIIKNEIEAYEEYYKYDLIWDVFPCIYPSLNKESFFIEKVDGKVIRDIYDNLNYNQQKELVQSFMKTLKILHSKEINLSEKEKYEYCYEEYVGKIKKRINLIKDSIFYFDSIKKVNWVNILRFEEVMKKVEKWLKDYIKRSKFTIIHWDCTFSNGLITKDNKIMFIDPRWKFWIKWVIWDKNYDIAKFLYSSLTSYDKFNFWDFYISYIDENEIVYNLPKYDIKIEEYLIKNYLNKDTKIILWIIWLWLAEYIKNDILKMNWAYYEWMRQLSLVFKW